MPRTSLRLVGALSSAVALSLLPQGVARAETAAAPVFDLCSAIPGPCTLAPVTGQAMAAPLDTQLPAKDCVTTGYKAGPFRYGGYLIAGFATQTSCGTAHTLEAQVSSLPGAVVTATSTTHDEQLCIGVKICGVSTAWASTDPGPICYANEGVTYYSDDYANTALPVGSVAGVICA